MLEKKIPLFLPGLLVFSGLFLLSVVLQWSSGAWKSDFGGHADEGAHVVTSLMVRDYLADGWKEQKHPIRYAEAYYERFPKVAIGHYPPGFYVLAGIVLLPIREPQALLLLMSGLCAGVGWATWKLGRTLLKGEVSPIVVAILLCLLPLVRTYTAIVMADLLLVFFTLLATAAFARFLKSERGWDALTFGIWATAAILTKGSGLCLALVPPLAILLTGRWTLVGRKQLWLAPVPVLLFALPWMWMTREITSEGMQGASALSYAGPATLFYFRGILVETGWIVWIAVVAAFVLLWQERNQRAGKGQETIGALISLLLASLLLMILLPTGLDFRYLMPVLPVLLLLAAWGLQGTLGHRWSRVKAAAITAFVGLTLATTWRQVEKRYTGATGVVKLLRGESSQDLSSAGHKILVVTDAKGEGALTAAAAFSGSNTIEIARGSKTLAQSDWLGRGYEMLFETGEELEELLDQSRITAVVVEDPPPGIDIPSHWSRVANYYGEKPEVVEVPSERRWEKQTAFQVYRR
jgi:hypothetical protein